MDVLEVFLSDEFREKGNCTSCTSDGLYWLYENEHVGNVIGEMVVPDEVEVIDDLPY
ncbi:MAG: hypothetical protein DHS20C18_55720 [Saprospiraceae bacterium]|nr:MAG: hypothetical protein DHS20C18_55720 [Saprospiraceae bacterium]